MFPQDLEIIVTSEIFKYEHNTRNLQNKSRDKK